jgi:hypothetical protein
MLIHEMDACRFGEHLKIAISGEKRNVKVDARLRDQRIGESSPSFHF